MVIRQQIGAVIAAVPLLPQALQRVGQTVAVDLGAWGAGRIALRVAAVLALGVACEWLFRRATAAEQRRLVSARLETMRNRLLAVPSRLTLRLGSVAAFALTGAMLLLD